MKKISSILISVVLVAMFFASSASAQVYYSDQSRYSAAQTGGVTGAVLGGVAGAVIGNNSGGRHAGQGAAIGAVAGAVVGTIIGQNTDNARARNNVVVYSQPAQVVYVTQAPTYYEQQAAVAPVIACTRDQLQAARDRLTFAESQAYQSQVNLDRARADVCALQQRLACLGGNQ